jgi:shikimate kinase
MEAKEHAPVFLTGFMCSGKSRVGHELAKLLGRRHADTDRIIEQQVGPLVPFFAGHGEAAFRELEERTLEQLITEKDVVVSTGGGMPAAGDNMRRMLGAGTVIWLDVPLEELMPRIERAGLDRPLLMGLKGEELMRRVETLLREREPHYAASHIIVQAVEAPVVVAARIRDVLALQDR